MPAFSAFFINLFDQAVGIVTDKYQIIHRRIHIHGTESLEFFIDIFLNLVFLHFQGISAVSKQIPQAHNACFHVLCRDHFPVTE